MEDLVDADVTGRVVAMSVTRVTATLVALCVGDEEDVVAVDVEGEPNNEDSTSKGSGAADADTVVVVTDAAVVLGLSLVD